MSVSHDGKTYDAPVLKPWRRDESAKGEPCDHGHLMAGPWVTIRVGAHPVWQGDRYAWKAMLVIHDAFRDETVQADLRPEELDVLIALLQVARRAIEPPAHLRTASGADKARRPQTRKKL